ncbi:MarR family winged helix-turn-helix transcriptional regulator [Breznakiella homolactica]|uniref:Winged helix-turn-helix transcriptional regulator n=1 Tax=Breznakiella homolactica TaxID=2798577 RepID=A0A7T7XK82_9SPIR|nr:MarR family winged helix-turn-helix transcriptional regulator [Breznakiella homolactica]QQO07778.1 MarR family winged helix-turn-helix transcriptional regulator [Breznakiella homolactica]
MESIFKWLAVLGRLGNQYLDQRLKDLEINSSHHAFIIHICDSPGLPQESLRRRVYVHPSNITRALEHLEKKGYITRKLLPGDKRTYTLHPTAKAKKELPHIRRVVADWVEFITQGLTETQIESFSAVLEKAGQSGSEYFFPRD